MYPADSTITELIDDIPCYPSARVVRSSGETSLILLGDSHHHIRWQRQRW